MLILTLRTIELSAQSPSDHNKLEHSLYKGSKKIKI